MTMSAIVQSTAASARPRWEYLSSYSRTSLQAYLDVVFTAPPDTRSDEFLPVVEIIQLKYV